MTNENTALTVRNESLPSTFEELNNMATAFVKSGMFQDTKQVAQAIVKIQAGRELGLPPVYSMQNINMIRDRLASSANTLATLVKKSGRYNYRVKEHSDTICSITFYEREGDKWVEVGTSTFTMEDAKRADLIKPGGGWTKYPRAMLFSRAISQGARMYCPDAIGGMYTDEEMTSIPVSETTKVDVTTGEIIPDAEQGKKDIEELWLEDTPEPITDRQLKKLFASAKEKGIEALMKDEIWRRTGKTSSKELTKKEASEIIEAIENGDIKAKSLVDEAVDMGGEVTESRFNL